VGSTSASDRTPAHTRQRLSGWGRTAPTVATVAVPRDAAAVAELVAGRAAGARGVIGRGLGRCYGDAAQSAGGVVVSTRALVDIALDPATGVAEVGAGASLDALLRLSVPQGWFVPVTPGTRFVTVAGAIAADVHGKNHHVDGTFGGHVRWIELVDGNGAVHRLAPSGEPAGSAAFWATVGGLGLTGVITRAAIQLRPVRSAWMAVHTERAPTLALLMDRLREHDRRYRYTVAWIDALATGPAAGRGVLTSGEHADGDAVRALGVADALAYHPTVRLVAPSLPASAVRRPSARAFDALWYRTAAPRPRGTLERLERFFHPLDGVRGWNRLYGPVGFLQYQIVVPDDREDLIELALRRVSAAGPAFLGVLKRFGAQGRAPLSFPRPGWTLAVDVPAPSRAAAADLLATTLDRLDDVVAAAGGAVYLVKDARCRPDLVRAMYPRLGDWQAVRDRLDPDRRFASDLSRRLGL